MSRLFTYPKPGEPVLPPPIDLSLGESEKFPIEAFPLVLRSVAQELAQVYQTPDCLSAMAALSVLSGAIGKSIVVRGGYKDKVTRLNLYVIAVAERGSGKGVIGEILAKPIIVRSREMSDNYRRETASMRAECGSLKREIERLQRGTATEGVGEHENRLDTLANREERLAILEAKAAREVELWIDNTTSEALGRALADNDETLFGFSAEAGAAVQVALGQYISEKNQGDFSLLLSAYSGDAVKVTRMKRRVQLDAPCLSLLWLVQGCVIRQLVSDAQAFSRGLTARPLIFDTGARREHDDRQVLTFTRGEKWGAFLNEILDRRLGGGAPFEIPCATDAREVFAKFHDESVDFERGPFADVVGELSRWRENAIKVGGSFAVAEGVTIISAAIAERAVSVVRWAGMNYLGLLCAGRRARLREDFERLLELIRDSGGEINLGPLARNHGIKRVQIEALIAAFPARLTIVKRPQPGAGRPEEILRAAT